MPSDDRRRRGWGPVVLGAEVPPAARQHPAYDTPNAPVTRDTATSWPPEVQRAPRVPAIPPPPRTSYAPQWAVGIATVITALGTVVAGAGYIVTEYRKSAAEGTVEMGKRFDRIEASIKTIVEDQQARDAVNLAVLCAVNGGSPARNVRCDPTACAERERARDGGFVGPVCKAVVDWPPIRRSP